MIFPPLPKTIRSPFLFSSKTTYYATARLSLILRILTILGILVLITYYTFRHSETDIFDDVFSSISSGDGFSGGDRARTAWIEKSLESDIDGPFDGKPIKQLCSSKRWQHRAAVSCGRIQGGVGNVRNVILTCLRFAIEAGADFVIPELQSRSSTDLSVLDTGDRLGFEYLFDEQHFRKSLRESCPGMKVYGTHETIETDQEGVFLGPMDLVPNKQGRVLENAEVAAWSGYFEKWLINQEATNSDKLSSGPIPVEFASPLFNWPTIYDGDAFMRSFGRVVQFREDTRRLAATVLWELSRKFELDLEPTEFMTGAMFFGAHLRTAADATKAKWTGYDVQAAAYLEQASKEHLSTIYVATGSVEDMERFSAQAWSEYQYNTTSKLDLLKGKDREVLQSLSWDQQGLVDFLVMLKSSSFAGIEQSSFAWNIVLKRHLLSSDPSYLKHKQHTFQDEYSMLLGPLMPDHFIEKAMWP